MSRSRWWRGESGTSSLEVVGLFASMLAIMILLIQAGVALYAVTATETAARHAARAYSLGSDPYDAASSSLPDWLDHEVTLVGTAHGVEIESSVPILVPGFDLTVTRSAEMP